EQPAAGSQAPLTIGSVSLAWAPWLLMSVALLLTGLVRQHEEDSKKYGPKEAGPGFVRIAGDFATNYHIPVPTLHNEVVRDPALIEKGKKRETETALFNFAWLTSPGTAVLIASLLSMVM